MYGGVNFYMYLLSTFPVIESSVARIVLFLFEVANSIDVFAKIAKRSGAFFALDLQTGKQNEGELEKIFNFLDLCLESLIIKARSDSCS